MNWYEKYKTVKLAGVSYNPGDVRFIFPDSEKKEFNKSNEDEIASVITKIMTNSKDWTPNEFQIYENNKDIIEKILLEKYKNLRSNLKR